MKKTISITSRVALVLVFLVVLAGSVVRMTGSGMGCPDWPKCFGYFIPPTEAEQLIWKPDHKYLKGQMILGNNELLVANQNFTSTETLRSENWRVYDKHDYAIFNPVHTWIEYINRLLGALSGIPVLLLFVLSFLHIKKDFPTFLLSTMALFALGFVAWLGKLVVDGNLVPHSITYHMFGAITVIVLLVTIIFRQNDSAGSVVSVPYSLRYAAIAVVVLSLIQVYLGTSVREQVDALPAALQRDSWIDALDWQFLVHRSFSLLILGVNLWWVLALTRAGVSKLLPMLLVVLLGVEVLAGVLLNYAGFPAAAQPVHLVAAMIIVAIQYYLMLKLFWPEKRRLFAI